MFTILKEVALLSFDEHERKAPVFCDCFDPLMTMNKLYATFYVKVFFEDCKLKELWASVNDSLLFLPKIWRWWYFWWWASTGKCTCRWQKRARCSVLILGGHDKQGRHRLVGYGLRYGFGFLLVSKLIACRETDNKFYFISFGNDLLFFLGLLRTN